MKRALDAAHPERRFECELIDANAQRVVVLYRFQRDGAAIESYGVFWRRRPYNCYYAVPAGGGAPLFVRFDIVRDVEFDLERTPPEVRYTDLLLDLLAEQDGPRWEDEDEVAAVLDRGTLSPSDARRIEATRTLLDRRWRRITAEVRALLQGLGAAV